MPSYASNKSLPWLRNCPINEAALSAFVCVGGVSFSPPDLPAPVLERLAVLLAELGRTEDASARFRQLLAADPDNTLARQWLKETGAEMDPSSQPD